MIPTVAMDLVDRVDHTTLMEAVRVGQEADAPNVNVRPSMTQVADNDPGSMNQVHNTLTTSKALIT